jgi:hypothetical protein
MLNKYISQNIFDSTRQRIQALNSRNRRLRKQQRIPTLQAYTADNWPDKSTYGQIVQDVENNGMMWIYGEDDNWYPIGGFPRIIGRVKYGVVDVAPGSQYTDISRFGPEGSPNWIGTEEEIILWSEIILPDTHLNVFSWCYDLFQRPLVRWERLFLIGKGGVYRANYCVIVENFGSPVSPNSDAAEHGYTQLYEPDFNGWTGYERYHMNLTGSTPCYGQVTFSVAYDVMELWGNGLGTPITPPGPETIRGAGQQMYLTVWVETGKYLKYTMGHPSQGPLGWWQGSFLEVIRLGDAHITDLYDGHYDGNPVPYPSPENADEDLNGNPIDDEVSVGSDALSVSDAPVIKAVQEIQPMNMVRNESARAVRMNRAERKVADGLPRHSTERRYAQ